LPHLTRRRGGSFDVAHMVRKRVLIPLVALPAIGAAVAVADSVASAPRIAGPSPANLGDSLPAALSEAQADAIPVGGTGRWRTVIFGSIYLNGPAGPGRYSGDVRSENDKSFSHCN
jgi:hypothetical protein